MLLTKVQAERPGTSRWEQIGWVSPAGPARVTVVIKIRNTRFRCCSNSRSAFYQTRLTRRESCLNSNGPTDRIKRNGITTSSASRMWDCCLSFLKMCNASGCRLQTSNRCTVPHVALSIFGRMHERLKLQAIDIVCAGRLRVLLMLSISIIVIYRVMSLLTKAFRQSAAAAWDTCSGSNKTANVSSSRTHHRRRDDQLKQLPLITTVAVSISKTTTPNKEQRLFRILAAAFRSNSGWYRS